MIKKWNKKLSFILWTLIWLPLSGYFPTHEHYPFGGFFSPIAAFFLPFMGGSEHSNFNFDMKYTYTPAVFFWVGCIVFIFACNLLKKYISSQNN